MKLLSALLLVALCVASDEISRPLDLEFLRANGVDPTTVPDNNCQGCSPQTSNSEACTDWNNVGIVWDNEGVSAIWSLFGAFSDNNICDKLSTRAEERIEEELRDACLVNRNNCNTISSGFNSGVNVRNCDDKSCLLWFLFCSIDCTQISCIYDLNCDP